MPRSLSFFLSPPSRTAAAGRLPQLPSTVVAGLLAWWRTLHLDDRTRFLGEARDAVELEQRLRQWDDDRVARAWQHTRF
jgi:hypothetical protein